MVGARVPSRSTALGTLAHPRAAGARWHAAGTTQSVLGWRTGAIRCTTCPLKLVEILHTAPQLLCYRQVQHTKPNTKNACRGWSAGRRRARAFGYLQHSVQHAALHTRSGAVCGLHGRVCQSACMCAPHVRMHRTSVPTLGREATPFSQAGGLIHLHNQHAASEQQENGYCRRWQERRGARFR